MTIYDRRPIFRTRRLAAPGRTLFMLALVLALSCSAILAPAASATVFVPQPGALPATAAGADLLQSGATGQATIRFDRAKYDPASGACVGITVEDGEQNKDAGGVETLTAQVTDSYPAGGTGDVETVYLKETAPDSGLFTASTCLPVMVAPPKSEDGQLQVNPGDVIVALYQDPDNPAQPKELAEVELAADLALVAGGTARGSVKVVIDPSLLPPGSDSTPGASSGETPRPLGLVIDPSGTPQLFGSDQFVFLPDSAADLARFQSERGAAVVETIPIPDGEETLNYVLLRSDPLQTGTDDLPHLLEMLGLEGTYVFSSKQAAALVSLVLEEQLGGRFIVHNPLAWFLGDPSTDEGGFSGFDLNWMGDPIFGVREAITYLDLIDRNAVASVNVAVIDGGFAGPADFPSGMGNPDFAPNFLGITQGNCDNSGCAGPASGENPIPFCAGGDGPGCDWHGTRVYSVIGAVANNSSGVIGVAGHGRDAAGTDGVMGVANPMLFRVSLPYMTELARAVTAADVRGAQVINISSGFPCSPLLGINICDGGVRTAITLACLVINSILGGLIPPPIANLLVGVSCVGIHAVFAMGGVAHADALQQALLSAALNNKLIVASGPEHITLPVIGEMGPFDAAEVQMLPCVAAGVLCVGWLGERDSCNLVPDRHADNPHGTEIDIWAPGSCLTTMADPSSSGGTTRFSGTSAAAPFVSGAAALMLAADPLLAPGTIRTILQRTSTLLPTRPSNGCFAHPTQPGQCVGRIDVLAAVQAAAAAPLSCSGWNESPFNDSSGSATRLSLAGFQPGDQLAWSGDLSIHDLNGASADEDWYVFSPPSLGAPSTRISIRLSTDDVTYGTLAMELYRTLPGGTLERMGRATVHNGAAVFPGYNLFSGQDYFVRIAAAGVAGLDDNCYGNTLTVTVIEPGPAADRYEPNDDPNTAATPTESWAHTDFDWRIVEHGVVPPTGPFVNGWHSEVEWRLDVRDLTLHDINDADFFRIALPDPVDPIWGGHPDIDPDTGPQAVEPMIECGQTTRRGFRSGTTDHLTFGSAVTVWIRAQAGNRGGEPIHLDGTTFDTGLTFGIRCPRSLQNLQELLIDVGARMDPRDDALTYDMTVIYGISIQRMPATIPADWGRTSLRCLVRGGFPFCDEDGLEKAQMVLRHPFDPSDDPLCIVDGCGDRFVLPMTEAGLLEVSFLADSELAFDLYDLTGEPIASAQPGGAIQDADGTIRFESHLVAELAQGLYTLAVSGKPGRFEMTYAPLTGAEHNEPGWVPRK